MEMLVQDHYREGQVAKGALALGTQILQTCLDSCHLIIVSSNEATLAWRSLQLCVSGDKAFLGVRILRTTSAA